MPQKIECSTIIPQKVKNNFFHLYRQDKQFLSIKKITLYLATIKNIISSNKHMTKYVGFIEFYSRLDDHIILKDNMINMIIVTSRNSKKT